MAWQEQGVWVAACIDFSLAAQGSSLDDVKRKLHEQIRSYVEEAMTIDSAHAEGLLSRSAPRADVLRYEFWRLLRDRPRMRRTLTKLAQKLAPRMRLKSAYRDLLPLRVA
jgi:predicted RNase H-like HicB family nuclease